ncbi:MAG: SUMF1/EgtB/PvdO family nonheme iron enzyme [Pseudomonadota bacterium]
MTQAHAIALALLAAGCGQGTAPPLPSIETEQADSTEKDPVKLVRIPGGVVRLGQDEPPRKAPVPGGGTPQGPGQEGAFPQVIDMGPLPSPQAREVRVSPFLMDLTEVTRAHYARFLEETHYRPPWVAEPWAEEWNWDAQVTPALADHPVVLVSWYDAVEYCTWARKRLPTEAEWQLAALGPAELGRTYPWGNTYDGQLLNHGMDQEPIFDDSDGYLTTSPVGAYPGGASPYGLLDAFGNVWEWASDLRTTEWSDYGGRQEDGMLVDPHPRGLGLNFVARGGSYYFHADQGAPEKNAFLGETRRKTSGFRCARSLE